MASETVGGVHGADYEKVFGKVEFLVLFRVGEGD